MTDADLLDLLPGELRHIGELIGVEGALILVEWRPGVKVYIPRMPHQEHELAARLGIERARKLCDEYGGETLELPVAYKWRLAMRNAIIANSDKSQSQLALAHKLTTRQIRSIQRALREQDDRQDCLF